MNMLSKETFREDEKEQYSDQCVLIDCKKLK